jgi:hypothetical protein
MIEKKSWAMSLLEAVFGKFAKLGDKGSTHRRCVKCRRRYDLTKMRGEKGAAFNRDRFCSQTCAEMSPEKPSDRRQFRFCERFNYYFAETRRKYGAGKNGYAYAEGMTRRSARLISRKVARKAMREAR